MIGALAVKHADDRDISRFGIDHEKRGRVELAGRNCDKAVAQLAPVGRVSVGRLHGQDTGADRSTLRKGQVLVQRLRELRWDVADIQDADADDARG